MPDEPSPITPRNLTVLVVAVVAVAVIAVLAVLIGRTADDAPVATPGTSATATVAAPAPPSTVPVAPTTTALGPPPYEVAQANGPGPLAVYASPGAAEPDRSLPASTKVGIEQRESVPLVLLVRSRPDPGWLEVLLPVRPNGSTGFVKADAVTVSSHPYRIEVDLGAFRLRAFDADRELLDAPIAEAADNTPTPGGVYFTTMLLQPPDPTAAYGTYAYGLSGYSDVLTEFNGGPGQLGIHGTNEPWTMGQKVSHGCLRLRNEDIDQLARVLPLGVPVVVRP